MPFSSLPNTDRFSDQISSLGKADIVFKQAEEVETEKCVQNRALELPGAAGQRSTVRGDWKPKARTIASGQENERLPKQSQAAQASAVGCTGLSQAVFTQVGRPKPASWRTGDLVGTG